MNVRDLLERAATDTQAALRGVNPALKAMRDACQGQPGAHAFDAIGSRTRTVLWCNTHEQDHGDCDPDWLCSGVPVATVSDPTGDAAVNPDPARADQRDLERAVNDLARAAARVAGLVARWTPHAPTARDLRETAKANDRGCQSCATVDRWMPVHRTTHVEALHLTRDVPLCRWCYDWHRKTGRLPTRDELRKHHDGKRVALPFTARALGGIQSGTLGQEAM